MYDESDGGAKFREFGSLNFAWWHTFKHACFMIWKYYAKVLWAPMWHHLYPATSFFVKPSSFASIQAHLQCVLLSYPRWKDQLQTVLDGDVDGEARVALMDLQFLIEFAIPAVNFLHFTLLHA